MDWPREPVAAKIRGRRLARRLRRKREDAKRERLEDPACAPVAAAWPVQRNACIALRLGVPRVAVTTAVGRRRHARQLQEYRRDVLRNATRTPGATAPSAALRGDDWNKWKTEPG